MDSHYPQDVRAGLLCGPHPGPHHERKIMDMIETCERCGTGSYLAASLRYTPDGWFCASEEECDANIDGLHQLDPGEMEAAG